VGVVVAGLWLVPELGIARTLAVGAALAVVSGALVVRGRGASPASVGGLVAAMLAVAVVGLRGESTLHVPVGSEHLVFYEEGRTATVSVLQEVTGTRTIYIDRVPVAGTDTIMLTDQKSLAHVPLLIHPESRRVLTVGFGSGGASWSFSRYPQLERIDAVEIDPSVFHAAPHLDDSNHGVWHDARFHLILEDARSYLASTDARYDVISTDCTDLRYKSNANLYTVDYFTLARDRLRPGGVVTVWMPLGGLGGDTFRMALRTFRQVFPHTTIWYMTNQPTHYLLLVGTLDRLRPDVDAMATAMRTEAVRSDLAEIRLDDPLKMAASLVLDEEEVASFAGVGPVNTDRHPLLEFAAPRLAYRDALAINLRAVAASRQPRRQRWDGSPAALTALEPYLDATPALIEGHARYQLGTFDYDGALAQYRLAAERNPADRSVGALVDDVERTREVWLQEFDARTRAGSADARDWMSQAALLRQMRRSRRPDAPRPCSRARRNRGSGLRPCSPRQGTAAPPSRRWSGPSRGCHQTPCCSRTSVRTTTSCSDSPRRRPCYGGVSDCVRRPMRTTTSG
jgi:spermidine synthase